MIAPADPALWRRFALSFAAAALGLTALLYGFILVLDPYGTRAGPGRAPRPIMDINQRFMYPQIVRSGRFDAAVFGTSTVRLLDPERLGATFGARFANLGMNAGTPWEQTRLAELFLRSVPRPKAMIFGLDQTWCEEDADAKILTFRTFPRWLYDDSRLNDLPELLDLTTLEIAGRLALHAAGLMPERIRGDGYEVFVPDEALYDVNRARLHIYRLVRHGRPGPAPRLTKAGRAELRLPALHWLDDLLARVPRETAVTLLTTPVHVNWQAAPGSHEAAVEAECKARLAEIGRRHGALVVDFRIPSAVTREDSNYWDEVHYRIGIATRLIDSLAEARRTGLDAADGFYRVLNPPGS